MSNEEPSNITPLELAAIVAGATITAVGVPLRIARTSLRLAAELRDEATNRFYRFVDNHLM